VRTGAADAGRRYNAVVSSVYLETSFFSECCTIRTGEIARGRRATSLNWWETYAPNKRTHLTIIAARARLRVPELVTPDLMRLE
jgi:hypothetical protein